MRSKKQRGRKAERQKEREARRREARSKEKKRFLSLLLCFSASLLLSFSYVAYASQPIADIQIHGKILTPKERILNLLPFKLGDPFDLNQLENGLNNLKKWGIFDRVNAETSQRHDGMHILIKLHEAKVISEIDIAGNYPYVETKVRKRLNLQVGEMVTGEKIEEQRERIKKFYERKGFYNTKVDFEEDEALAKNSVNVTFHIYKGERLRYNAIEVEGNQTFRKGRIYSFLKPMDIYSEKRLKETLQKLTNFYRARGYLKARVRVQEIKIDSQRRRVFLKLSIHEGPKVKIFFRGSKQFRLKTLKRTVGLFQEGNFDPASLQTASENLIQRFQKEGFREPQVHFQQKKIRPNLFHILFYIKPGVRSFIHSIDFKNNEFISDGKLKKHLLSQERAITNKGILEEPLLEEDQKIALELYQGKGFSDASISKPTVSLNPKRTKYSIEFEVNEGAEVTVEKISFEGNSISVSEKLLKSLQNKEASPFNELALSQDLEHVQLFFINRGYPYAQIQQTIKRKENKIIIQYFIVEGPLVKIGEILIVGDVLTGVKAIRQALRIKSGDPYNYQKIMEAQLALRRLGAFNAVSVETIGLEEKQTTIHLKVKVEERQPFVVDLDTQYSTDKQYSGTLKFTNFNSFGWAKQTGLSFLVGKEKDRVELLWFDPRFAGADVQMTLSSWMDYEKKPLETSLQTAGAVAFFRQFRRFGFLSRYELARNYIVEGRAKDPGSLRDSTLSQIALSGSFDGRDSFSDSRRGFFTLVGTNIFNEIQGLEANFAKLKMTFSHYYSPIRWATLSNTARMDRIQTVGSNVSIPGRQLLTLGGDDTLRGFSEDSLGPTSGGRAVGGRLRWIYTSEMHIRLVKSFQGAIFYDAGSLTDSFAEVSMDTMRHSVGFGLRYITPVGPIRADYGIILDPKPGENFGRFHLTFGYPF